MSTLVSITTFTLFQGMMSTVFAAISGLGLAFLLKGRITLPAPAYLPFLMPSLITGFAWIFTMSLFNMPAYGTLAIICVHGLMNTPLIAIICLQAFQSVPQESKKLSKMLHLSKWHSWKLLEGYALKKRLPIALIFVLILCIHGLCIPLLLGGGPKGTTLEVALYQSLRFDTNLIKASSIALIQMTLSGLLIFILTQYRTKGLEKPLSIHPPQIKKKRSWLFSSPLYGLYALFFFHCCTVGDFSFFFDTQVLSAVFFSLSFAMASVLLGTILFLILSTLNLHFQNMPSKTFQTLPLLMTTTSPLTLCLPIFMLFWPHLPDSVLIIFIHSLLVLPLFIVRIGPVLQNQIASFSPLFSTLKLPFRKCFAIIYQGIKPTVHQTLGLSLCLCLGELGAVSLFSIETETLSTLLYGALTKFSYDKALTIASVLMMLCLFFLSLSQKHKASHI
jgi:thiamine transport system permease protein